MAKKAAITECVFLAVRTAHLETIYEKTIYLAERGMERHGADWDALTP